METENAYVNVVSRKLRNLRKKLARVEEIEQLVQKGKELEKSQLEALASKASTITSIKDLEMVKAGLIEVASRESTPTTNEAIEEENLQIEAFESLNINESGEKRNAEFNAKDVEDRLRSLVLCLNICANYKMRTGKDLPAEVEYFGSVVLGRASVSDFNRTIEQSLKSVGFFIFVSMQCFCSLLFCYLSLFF